MSNIPESAEVMCPYYRAMDETYKKDAKKYKAYVTCEGIENAAFTTIRFPNKIERDKFMEKRCNCFPNDCAIAKLIERKYEGL